MRQLESISTAASILWVGLNRGRGALLAALLPGLACGKDEPIDIAHAGAGGAIVAEDSGAGKAGGGGSAGDSMAGTSDSGGRSGDAMADGTDSGGSSGDEGGTGADSDGPASIDGLRGCLDASNCEHAKYYKPVMSEAECYCPVCAGDFGRVQPLNRETHARYREQWMMFCANWMPPTPCLPLPCPILPPPACEVGQCVMRLNDG